MEKRKQKVSYSIIRYSPDAIKGEMINIGVLLFNFDEKQTKYCFVDENSSKLRAVVESKIELEEYKSYKEVLEYYLKESKNNIAGVVGKVFIASYFNENYLEELYEHTKNNKLYLSKPNIAYTRDINSFFSTILNRYVGEKNVRRDVTTMTAKKYMKQIFSSNDNLNKRVRSDVRIKPIEELKDLEVNIDFMFKNGKWNYMQTIPKITNANKNSEWFSKIQLILDENTQEKTKIHLIYRNSDIIDDNSTLNLLKYLQNKYTNLEVHDIDQKNEIENLCRYIETEGQILEEAS